METSKSEFAKKKGKYGLFIHAPISAVFSLFFLPLSFFLSLPFFFLLVSYYSLVVGCSPFWSFLFLGPFLWVFTTFLPWVFSLRCFLPHWVPPLSVMVTSSFCSELIQWDFSLLPLRLHQLFWACCGHPFRTTHQPIGCPTTTSA